MAAEAKKPNAIVRFVKNRYRSYTPDGKFWLSVGFVCLIVDMAIGYMAGKSVATVWHGIGGAALALGFAFLPDAAYEEGEHGRYASAIIIGALGLVVGFKAYEQQLTYTAGMRHGEMTGVKQVNARKSNAQNTVKDNEALLKVLRDQLTTHESEKAALVAANAWAPTIKAEALRDQVASAEAYIKMEAERGGCKQKCEARMRERDALVTRIGTIEKLGELDKLIMEKNARIEATNRALAGARDVDDKREIGTSLNVSVAETTAAMVNLMWGSTPEKALEISDTEMRYATIGSAGLGSLALLVMAPIGFFLAGRRRYKEGDPMFFVETPMPAPAGFAASVAPAVASQLAFDKPAQPSRLEFKIDDNRALNDLKARLDQALSPFSRA